MKKVIWILAMSWGLISLNSCSTIRINNNSSSTYLTFSEAWPHGPINEIFDDVFMVTGTNIIEHEGLRLRSSRNMVVVREGQTLTLINTVRLNEKALKELESLGQIKNIIRIGAFHGRDDSFYQNRYQAKLYALANMSFEHGEVLHADLNDGPLPITNAEVFSFKSTKSPEALVLLKKEGGILISCDSIKNWTKQDQFFDKSTFDLMKKINSIGEAKIDSTWRSAMEPSTLELKKLGHLKFRHLISAHGTPLLDLAQEKVQRSILEILQELN